MKLLPRGFTVLFAAIIAVMVSCPAALASRTSNAKEAAKLPFTVNLAPGDVLVHGTDRGINGTDQYQQHPMEAGDQVIGSIGKLRSVILTGDASAVEVLPGSTLTAENHGGAGYLDLNMGVTRVGRASTGDGTPIRLLIQTHQVGAVIHGGDLLVSKGGARVSTVVQPEPDRRYLFSGRVSLVSLNAVVPVERSTVRPAPSFSYFNSPTAPVPTHQVTVLVHKLTPVPHHHWHHRHHRHHSHHHHHHHYSASNVSVRVTVHQPPSAPSR